MKKTLFKIGLLLSICISCSNQNKTAKVLPDTDVEAPTAKTETWQQYLKRDAKTTEEIPTDSNCLLVLDYQHLTYYNDNQLKFQDSLVVFGENDSFLVYRFFKQQDWQLGLNKTDSTILITTGHPLNSNPVGEMQYFKKKQKPKSPFDN